MTTRPYSKDLRERVIYYVKDTKNQASASRLFKVSTSTVSRWWARYQQEGKVEALKRQGSKGKISLNQLQQYVEQNPNSTLSEIGKIFKVSNCAIHNRLKELGFSYKKSL
jgi:transposase